MRGDTRGQGFTVEGVVGAIILLTALLFALQIVTVLPTSSGSVSKAEQADLRTQANDVLVTSAQAEGKDLSTLVRNWSQSDRTFVGATNPRIGYGSQEPPGPFGEMLNATFTRRSYLYNVEMEFLPKNASEEPETVPVVYRGDPSDRAVTASYTVTLYDNQTLTAPNASQTAQLWQYDTNATNNENGYYPVPNAVDGPVYNVVKVRVIVW